MAIQTEKIQNLGGSQILYNDLRKRAASADGNLADEYSASKTYAVGDFVVYLDKLYTCNTAITTPEAWTAAHWEETSVGDDVASLKKEMPEKADRVGVYPDITSGTAEQLASTQYVENAEAYKHRATGGSADVGDREYLEKIVGGTVCWNQLCDLNSPATKEFSDGASYYGTFSDNLAKAISLVKDRVYLIAANIDRNIADNNFINVCISSVNTGPTIKLLNDTANGWAYNIHKQPKDESSTKIAYSNYGGKRGFSSGDSITVNAINCYDLTAMFGPTIADYVYNLEQTTAGAGVAWFRRYFPNNYYEYNPGELISVSGLRSHDTVGFNAWDEEWESGVYNTNTGKKQSSTTSIRSKNLFKVIPGARYSLTKPTTNQIFGLFYDESGQLVVYVRKDGDTGAYNSSARFALASAKATFTVPAGATQMSLRMDDMTVYNHDICVHLVHSGTRDGEYEPYEKHSYPLDSSVVLLGVPKLDENGNLHFDGDEYASDGQVSRKYGFLLDMGTLNWSGSSNRWSANIPTLSNKAARTAHMMCSRYPALFNAEGYPASGEKVAYCGLHNVYVHDDSYSSVAEFKSAMSGVMLVYELDTPVTETAEPYTEIQVCSDWGTEEFVSDSILPVGHLTRYPANLRDKLQHLPSLAESDGDYIVRQTGSQMSLVGLGDTAEVAGIKNDISELRATDAAQGIYVETESKPIVSISDGADDQPMKSVKVSIEPVQDKHGYDYPWTAGGGKNIIPPIKTTTNYNVTFTQDGDYINISGTPSGNAYCVLLDDVVLPAGTYTLNGVTGASNASYRTGLKIADDTSWTYNSESQRTFTLEAESKVRIALFVYPAYGTFDNFKIQYQLERGDAVTPWTPYSNICPISGHTGVTVTRAGVNILDLTTMESGYYNADGVKIASAGLKRTATIVPVNPGDRYSLKFEVSNNQSSRLRVHEYDKSGTWLRQIFVSDALNAPTVYEKNLTVSNDAYFIAFSLPLYAYLIAYFDLDTYEVTFPTEAGTVYGGTLDVASGKLSIDRVLLDTTWGAGGSVTEYDDRTRKRWTLNPRQDSTQDATAVCNLATYQIGTAPLINRFSFNATQPYFYLSLAKDTDETTPIQVCYRIANPQEITLTPTEITTLLGINNVWSDAGNTSVTYPADTKMYIDSRINASRRLIAGIETGFVASKLYAVGDMLIIGDDLYKVTAQIASGATITVGTNVNKTTVAEQLIALVNA